MKNSNAYNITDQLLKFCGVGILSTFCHIGTLVLLVEKLKIKPTWASAIGFVVAVIVSFMFNSRWTFKAGHSNGLKIFFRYVIVCVVGLILNFIVMFILINIFNVWYLLSQVLVIGVVTPTNFFLNRRWAFKKK